MSLASCITRGLRSRTPLTAAASPLAVRTPAVASAQYYPPTKEHLAVYKEHFSYYHAVNPEVAHGPADGAPRPKWASQPKSSTTFGVSTKTAFVGRTSPFAQISRGYAAAAGPDTHGVPDFSKYKSIPGDEISRNTYLYLISGATGVVSSLAAKATVVDFLSNLAASADVLALAKVEVDLSKIPEGRNVVLKWRGKPIFIRHRTAEDIQIANSVDIAGLRHPETDADRVKKPEWLVMLGVCTHLGCVPLGDAGDFGGWFCPCHGSHYDISGRIRQGPAPLNLEIPPYTFVEEEKIVIG